MSTELKEIQITGGAAEDFSSVMRSGKKRRTSRKQRKGGGTENQTVGKANMITTISKQQGGTSPGTLVALQASSVPKMPGAPEPKGYEATPTEKPAPAYSNLPLKGGEKPEVKPKVVLQPPNKKSQLPKVHLAAPKAKSHTQTKKARKIRVSLSGLGKRMTRHKTIQKEAKALPLDKVKKILEEAKLLKPDSKAPESMIRQIYADYQTLKNKAL